MYKFSRERFNRHKFSFVGNIFLCAGVTCLFFGITPTGVKPQAPGEAWGFAMALFAVAFVLFVVDRFRKR